MPSGLIVLEGANATGKSTLAAEMVKRYDAVVMHQTYRFKNRIFDYHTAVLKKAVKLSATRLVVLDRLWMSEEVYARIYRSGTPWPHQGRMVDRVLAKASAVTIICSSRDEELAARYRATRQHRTDADVEKNLKVNARFRDLLLATPQFLPYRFTYMDDLLWLASNSKIERLRSYTIGDDVDHLVGAVLRFIENDRNTQYDLALTDDNFLGNLNSATGILVGDRPNTTKAWSWPFYAYHDCSLWLATQLHHAVFNESLACWTNACSDPSTIQRVVEQKDLRVVALGANAARALDHLKIAHTPLRHPQYCRRFRPRDPLYVEQIAKAICP